MNRFTKLLVAVVACFAYSCAVDSTADIAVALDGCQTTIDISLEESRTHIVGKVGEDYPLYWSEGDKVAVNGVVSQPLDAAAHGKQRASFVVDGEVGYPRNIVYPAPAEGVLPAEGKQVVTFLANQNYSAGTFAEGAVPMYAYAESEGDAILLQHLAGVLCFAPKGDATLKAMVVSVEEGKLAGNFDVDCTNGALTPHADALNSVAVSFGEGLTLGAEATPIYVAVPAGEYGKVTVTLYTATDSMVVSFYAEEERGVKAGIVREFAPFDYKAGEQSNEFLIYDEASLRSFAANASKFGTELAYTSAKVVANIDMTGKAWSPIEGFGEYLFDGGSDKGFSIKGLTAPLFHETAASIKNVKLVDVKIVDTKTYFGALAYNITGENAVVENCYVGGTMDIKISAESAHVAGLFDTSASTQKFSNLTSELYIKITGNITKRLDAVGCLYSHSGALENVTHLGTIEYAAAECADLRIGGVTQSCKSLTNCVNGSPTDKSKGNLIVNGTCAPIRIGGIAALATNGQTMTHCVNYGKVYTTANATSNQIFMGGICGLSQNASATFDACENNGELAIEQSVVNASGPRVGGFIGQIMTSGTPTIKNGFVNRGDININPKDCFDNIQVAGFIANYSTDIATSSTGVIKNEGHITYSGKASSGTTRVAGIVAASAKAFPHGVLTFVNEGDITVTGTAPTLTVGGIYGNKGKKLVDARCFCNIVATTTTDVGMIESGEYSTSYPILSSHVGGTIQVGDNEKVTIDSSNFYEYVQAGFTKEIAHENQCGYISHINAKPIYVSLGESLKIGTAADLKAFAESAATTLVNVELTANIDMTGEVWSPIEGYTGTFDGKAFAIKGLSAPLFGTTKASIKNLNLTELDITLTEPQAQYGVLACKVDNEIAVVENCSASGKMKIDLNMTEAITGVDGDIVIGGLVGATTSKDLFSDLVNDVDIEISGTYKNALVAAGILGNAMSCSLSNSTNLGTIAYNGESASNVFLGGLVIECKVVTDCVNGSASDRNHAKGALTIDGKTKNAYAAGFAPSVRSNISLVRCHNYGAITYTTNAVTGGTTLPAGGVSYCSPTSAVLRLESCSNNGPITVDNSTIGGDLKVGGLIAHLGGSSPIVVIDSYTNTGDFNINPVSVPAGKSVQIGGMIGNYSSTWTTDSTGTLRNKGNITYGGASSSTSTVRVGGILAALAKEPPTNLKLVNTGNLNVTGTGKLVYVGGILGAGKNVVGADCHCEIYAPNASAVGWIMAAARTSTLTATNCGVGGRNITGWDDSDMEPVAKGTKITASTYMNYIYSGGNNTDWSGTENYDGCTFLSQKPQ